MITANDSRRIPGYADHDRKTLLKALNEFVFDYEKPSI